MKFLGTDFGLRFVIADINGQHVTVSWRESFWKGVYDVNIRCHPPAHTKVESVYPGFIRRIQEMWLRVRVRLLD